MRQVLIAMLILTSASARADDRNWTLGGVGIGASTAAVVKQLGPPHRRHELGAWRYADGLVVTMSAANAVRGIQISAPSKLRTAEGIGIGSSLAAVKKAYGRSLVAPADGGTAWTVGNQLMLTIDHDKVWAIYLGARDE
jgi:hypothetical protein